MLSTLRFHSLIATQHAEVRDGSESERSILGRCDVDGDALLELGRACKDVVLAPCLSEN